MFKMSLNCYFSTSSLMWLYSMLKLYGKTRWYMSYTLIFIWLRNRPSRRLFKNIQQYWQYFKVIYFWESLVVQLLGFRAFTAEGPGSIPGWGNQESTSHALSPSVVSDSCAPMDCILPGSVGFPRQKYWSGLPFLPPKDLPKPGIEPKSPELAGRFFTTARPREAKQAMPCV